VNKSKKNFLWLIDAAVSVADACACCGHWRRMSDDIKETAFQSPIEISSRACNFFLPHERVIGIVLQELGLDEKPSSWLSERVCFLK
jgi:hypothetical protein